jgi:hypothetical protein
MHALQVEHAEKTIILGPGNHTYNSKLHVRERKQIVGLYDTHWSNKTSDQKSVLICRGIQVYDSMSSVAVTFKVILYPYKLLMEQNFRLIGSHPVLTAKAFCFLLIYFCY